jgi:hypothetical protein
MRGPRAVHAAVTQFATTCSDYKQPTQLYVELLTGKGIPTGFSEMFTRKFLRDFGAPRRTRALGEAIATQWDIPKEGAEAVLTLLEGPQPPPKHRICPMVLNLVAEFRLTDPQTGSVLPHQDRTDYLQFEVEHRLYLGTSTLYARFSSVSTVSLFFSLPYEEVGPALRDHVRFLQSNLPFQLSANHWKRWHINKAGTRYVGRRISDVLS